MIQKKSNPATRADAGRARECDCLEAVTSEIILPKQDLQALLPSCAALARRWPSLKLNRYTGSWRDDATGAKGASIESLLAFLGEGGR